MLQEQTVCFRPFVSDRRKSQDFLRNSQKILGFSRTFLEHPRIFQEIPQKILGFSRKIIENPRMFQGNLRKSNDFLGSSRKILGFSQKIIENPKLFQEMHRKSYDFLRESQKILGDSVDGHAFHSCCWDFVLEDGTLIIIQEGLTTRTTRTAPVLVISPPCTIMRRLRVANVVILR